MTKNTRIKTFLALAAALIIILAGLTGCISSTTPTEPIGHADQETQTENDINEPVHLSEKQTNEPLKEQTPEEKEVPIVEEIPIVEEAPIVEKKEPTFEELIADYIVIPEEHFTEDEMRWFNTFTKDLMYDSSKFTWHTKPGLIGELNVVEFSEEGLPLLRFPRTIPREIAHQIVADEFNFVDMTGEFNDEFTHPGTQPTEEQIQMFGDYAKEWPEFVGYLDSNDRIYEACRTGRKVIMQGFEECWSDQQEEKRGDGDGAVLLYRNFPGTTDAYQMMIEAERDYYGYYSISTIDNAVRDLAPDITEIVPWSTETRQVVKRYLSYFLTRDEARVVLLNLDEVINTNNALREHIGLVYSGIFDSFRTQSGLAVRYMIYGTRFQVEIWSGVHNNYPEMIRDQKYVEEFRREYLLD